MNGYSCNPDIITSLLMRIESGNGNIVNQNDAKKQKRGKGNKGKKRDSDDDFIDNDFEDFGNPDDSVSDSETVTMQGDINFGMRLINIKELES